MKCLRMVGSQGLRYVPVGVTFQSYPGENPSGVSECPPEINDPSMFTITAPQPVVVRRQALIDELDTEIGPGVGDWVKVLAAPVAKLIGKSKCSACSVRNVILNAYSRLSEKHGKLKAVGIIKDLTLKSMSDPEGAAAELKTYI